MENSWREASPTGPYIAQPDEQICRKSTNPDSISFSVQYPLDIQLDNFTVSYAANG